MLEEIIRDSLWSRATSRTYAGVLPAPEPEPALPPAVPEANKELWNYMGSELLLEAVEDGVVSQMEAEVVMEIGAYRRSVNYTALAVGVSPERVYPDGALAPERVIELYESGIRKLRIWLSK